MSRYTPRMLLIAAAAVTAGAFATLPASAEEAPAAPADMAAQPAPKPERPLNLHAQVMFNLIDVNGDGSIDQAEVTALQKAIFTAIDADKDGKLSQEEFRKLAPGGDRGRHARMMRHRGAPGWQQHGPRGPEFAPGGPRGGEFRNHGGGPRGQDFRGPRGDRQRHGSFDRQSLPGKGATAPRDFASLDANKDGTVSPDEFAKGALVLPFFPQ